MASELAAALAKFQAALPRIVKGETANAGTYTYAYAGLDEVAAVVLPALGKVGLSFACFPTMADGQFVLSYSLLHEGGEERTGTWPLGTGTPQQRGSAITYGRRYCLMAVTGVFPGGEDDDGKAAAQAPAQQRGGNGRASAWGANAEYERTVTGPPEGTPEQHARTQHTRGPIPADQDRWTIQNVSPAVAPSPPARTASPVPAAGETHHPGPAPTGHPAGREPAAGPGPARASTGQAGIIHTHFGRLGFGDDEREQRLVATAVIAGVESVTSTKDLDEVQARRVMDTLSRCKDRDTLIALLAAGDKPGSDG
jgi:ERF superfamily